MALNIARLNLCQLSKLIGGKIRSVRMPKGYQKIMGACYPIIGEFIFTNLLMDERYRSAQATQWTPHSKTTRFAEILIPCLCFGSP